MSRRPNIPESELQKMDQQLDAVEQNLTKMASSREDLPVHETERQTKLSQKDLRNATDIYLKPIRNIGCRAKFNEKFREDWNFAKEFVQFIAENKEVIGDDLEIWTKPFAGVPYEEWKVPTNKPVWGPRYLAEQIKRKTYTRYIMGNKSNTLGTDGSGQYYTNMVAEQKIHRLDAYPVIKNRSVFMGETQFN